MLGYDRIDISERMDFNKTSASKECDICLYWWFLDSGCHDLMQKGMNFNDVAIVSIKGGDYRRKK